MNELTTAPETAIMAPGFNSAASWDLAQRIGKAFAASSLVPQTYQNNLANCIVALEMAHRMGASPLMVMQNLYIVHGNPGWSSKFLVACFNQSGRFSSLRYEWNETRTACRAWAIEKSTNERIDGPQVSIEMAKAEGWSTKNGSKWKTMPELMLMYRAAAFLIRTYAPEISMGLSTEEEIRDMEPAPRKGSVTLAELLPTTPAPEDDETETDQETGEITETTNGPTYAQLADMLTKATKADTATEVLDLGRHLPDDQRADLAKLFETKFPN